MAICPNGHDSANSDVCDLCGLRIAGRYERPAALDQPPAFGQPPAFNQPPAFDQRGARHSATGGGEPCPRCGTARVGQFCEQCGHQFGPQLGGSQQLGPQQLGGAQQYGGAPQVGATQPPWAPAPPATPPAGDSYAAPPAPAPWPPPPGEPPRSFQAPPWVPAPAAPAGPSAPRPFTQSGWLAVVSCDRGYHENVQAANASYALVSCPEHYAERRFSLRGSRMQIGRRSVARGVEPEIDLTGPPGRPGCQPPARGFDCHSRRRLVGIGLRIGQRHARQRERNSHRSTGSAP